MERPKRNIERARQMAQNNASAAGIQPDNGVPFRTVKRKKLRSRAKAAAFWHKKKQPQPDTEVGRRIQDIRIQRVRRRRRLVLAAVLVVLALLAWATGLYGASLGLAGDIAEGIQVRLDSSGSWPMRTNISRPLQAEELSGGFVLLGREDLLVASPSGAKLRSIQHGYGRPAVTTGSNRFCLYNRAGNSLRVETRTKTVQTKTTEEPIILCQLGSDGSLAVVTQAQHHAARLTVYSRDMLEVYRWDVNDDNGVPVQVAFSSGGRWLAVGCIGARDGRLCTTVHFTTVHTNEDPVSCSLPGSTVLAMEWLTGSTVLVVTDNMAAVLNRSGEVLYQYDYGGNTLQDYDISGKTLNLLFADPAGSRVVILNSRMEEKKTFDTEAAVQLAAGGNRIYLLRETAVSSYKLDGTFLETTAFDAAPRVLLRTGRLIVFVDGQAISVAG